MPRLAHWLLGITALLIAASPNASWAQTTEPPRGCMNDGSLQICVTSAALTAQGGSGNVGVSVALRITNVTQYPIEVALHDTGWGNIGFTPQNAETIPTEGSWSATGLQACDEDRDCTYTTLASRASALMQIRYPGEIDESGWQLAQVARSASFSTSLLVRERGSPRVVGVALEGIAFGNALGGVRR